MLVAISVWIFPAPVHSHAKETQKLNTQVAYSPANNGRGVLRPKQNLQVNVQFIQEEQENIHQRLSERPKLLGVRENPQPNTKKNSSNTKPLAKETSSYNRRDYSKEEVQALIIKYSQQYRISPKIPLSIARCESGYNYSSKNKHSTASGVFQYLNSSWASTPEAKSGRSVFDAEANVSAAVRRIKDDTSPWNSSKPCWSKNN